MSTDATDLETIDPLDLVEEDNVPDVHDATVDLPVVGRTRPDASREEVVRHLAEAARLVRRQDIRMVHAAGLGHIGGEFSVIDVLVTLYLHVMNIDPERLDDPERDRCILSKGHAAAALYSTFAVAGLLPVESLSTFMQPESGSTAIPPAPRSTPSRPIPARSGTACRSRWARPWPASWTDRAARPSSSSVTGRCRRAPTGRPS